MNLKAKIKSCILVGVFILTSVSMTVFSSSAITHAEENAKTPEEVAAEKAAEEAAVYAVPVDSNGLEKWPQGPPIYSEAGIVMDINSGAILYAKGINDRHYPASITKVLTALVALDQSKLTDRVRFSEDSISFLEYGDAHIGMTPGEEISMEDALYAVLLASANEVSHAVAECAVEGGYDAFINKMNEKVTSLGGTNSHFVNANGLHNEEHYTCARDMALIASAAFQYPEFRTITHSLQHTIAPTNLQPEPRIFQQNHKMLFDGNTNYYEYCVGGKTGYTDQALNTLVTFADNGTMQLVAVSLKTHGSNVYPDARGMLDYVFTNFKKIPITDSEKSKEIAAILPEKGKENPYVVLPNTLTFADLKEEISCSGTKKSNKGIVKYSYEGQFLGSAPIQASEAYFQKKGNNKSDQAATPVVHKEKARHSKQHIFTKLVKIVIVVVLLILVLVVALFEAKKAKKRKMIREKRRMHKRKKRNHRE
ncbi:MAG: D-alanyl-D-alanine carboxypeptidase family protein [Lachnospiraceae bacterium]